MYLTLRADERNQTIIGRYLKVGAHARSLLLVQGFYGRYDVAYFARHHVVIVEILVSRAQDYLVAA